MALVHMTNKKKNYLQVIRTIEWKRMNHVCRKMRIESETFIVLTAEATNYS